MVNLEGSGNFDKNSKWELNADETSGVLHKQNFIFVLVSHAHS